MLTALTKKLCPLMSLAIATIGCGKKIAESDVSQPSRQTENQELPSAYVIQLDGSEASKKQFKMINHASFEIPDSLIVRSGNTIGKVVEIAYDVSQFDSTDYEFKCRYIPSDNPSLMVLSECVNYDNADYGDTQGQLFRLYKNDIIEMRFTGAPSQDMVVEAIYGMDWF